MNETAILPMDIEKILVQCKNEKWDMYNLHSEFPNMLMREDALALLEKFCTVVYYPLANEGNHGFHVTNVPFRYNEPQNFVFINTAQTIEKQVFTAAHELGHIWEVDKYVMAEHSFDDTDDMRERVISRFAAILLMPEDVFKSSFYTQFKELAREDNGITITNMLKLLVILMNYFFVPFKSVVLRCVELDILLPDTANVLLGNNPLLSKDDIEKKLKELFSEFGYVRFQNPSNRKWIDGLAEKLDIAEKLKSVSQSKIDELRQKFDLMPKTDVEQMNEVVSIGTEEGNGT